MRGKDLRWKDLFNPSSLKTFIIDISKLSELPMEPKKLQDVFEQKLDLFDVIVANPGFLEKRAQFLSGIRKSAIMRLDWSNVHRLNANAYPLEIYEPKHVLISSSEDALYLGAKAVVVSFILGFDENLETKNIEMITEVIRESLRLSMPVIVDIEPIGQKIMDENFEKACELGLTMMTEAGADCVLLPKISIKMLEKMKDYREIELIVKLENVELNYIENVKELVEGFYMDIFNVVKISKGELEKLFTLVHN
ncbi:MAG: hypothetical protein J7K69_05135 [Thermotogae bacterium]|nr:hypothetical protein [Thermotogota bacterium]